MADTFDRSVRRGYTTTVVTPWGRETYQVWLSETPQGWMARIVTLPNRMWAQPGGREAVKFCGSTEKDVELAAIRFIEDECIRTRRRMAPPVDRSIPFTLTRASDALPPAKPAPRFPHRLLVRFGAQNPDRAGVTANVSESGLFIITDQPAPVGSRVLIDLRTPHGPVVLGGEVVWKRDHKEPGRSLGFGVRLTDRPREYVQQLRAQP